MRALDTNFMLTLTIKFFTFYFVQVKNQ